MDGPRIVVAPPGPKSLKIWEEEKKHITPGLSVNPVSLRGMKSLRGVAEANVAVSFMTK